MPSESRSCPRNDSQSFSDSDVAFALAWEIYAPGLCGWTVRRDFEDTGEDLILVDPPLNYGNGFMLSSDESGVLIEWQGGRRRMPTVRDALLLICPLPAEALAAADYLATQPDPTIS